MSKLRNNFIEEKKLSCRMFRQHA